MHKKELQLLERRLMLIGVLLFLCAWFFGTGVYLRPFTKQVQKDILSIVLMVFLQWMIVRQIMYLLRRWYPDYRKTLTRIILSVFSGGVIGLAVGALVFDVPAMIAGQKEFSPAMISAHFGPMFFFSALVVGAHEVMYNFFELRRIDKEREELRKAHLQSQLDSLKTQVNPHFLFNSLNTLLSLISVSPGRAEAFVLELSSVYRYLLQANEKEMTTVEQELKFAHSYFHLLKTRYEDGIQLLIDVDDKYINYLVPSLTLQLLLENAVKHNVISSDKPLKISVFTKGTEAGEVFLTVQNNLQRKTQAVLSNQMGLNNILAKFKLMNRDDVLITDKDNCFTVSLPLIKK